MRHAAKACLVIVCAFFVISCAPASAPSSTTPPAPTVLPSQIVVQLTAAVGPSSDPTSSTPTGGWSIVPMQLPSNSPPLVLMRDNGAGMVKFGMTPDQVHQRCTQFSWDCWPDTGLDQDGFINVGSTSFNFVSQKLTGLLVTDGMFVTQQGFKVGDSLAVLTQAYGSDYQKALQGDQNSYTYTLSGGFLLTAWYVVGKDKANSWTMSVPDT